MITQTTTPLRKGEIPTSDSVVIISIPFALLKGGYDLHLLSWSTLMVERFPLTALAPTADPLCGISRCAVRATRIARDHARLLIHRTFHRKRVNDSTKDPM